MILFVTLFWMLFKGSHGEDCWVSGFSNMYSGRVNVTGAGIPCQAWSVQYPHEHNRHEYFPNDQVVKDASNFCRDPDGEGMPWCYTINEDVRWDFCYVSHCSRFVTGDRWIDCYVPGYSHYYLGNTSVTTSGRTCQAWYRYPHLTDAHFPTLNGMHYSSNFCRDPDLSGKPWCYTKDPLVRREYCGIPICYCGFLPAPTNGKTLLSNTTFGSIASYSCDTGYNLVGSSTSVCPADGEWSGEIPVCTVIDCGVLPSPLNGKLVIENATEGFTAHYSCNTGYNLVGGSSRKCHENGTWGDIVDARCNIKDCGPLEIAANGHVKYSSGTTYQSVATFTCSVGYTLVGPSSSTCQESATWTDSNPECYITVVKRRAQTTAVPTKEEQANVNVLFANIVKVASLGTAVTLIVLLTVGGVAYIAISKWRMVKQKRRNRCQETANNVYEVYQLSKL